MTDNPDDTDATEAINTALEQAGGQDLSNTVAAEAGRRHFAQLDVPASAVNSRQHRTGRG